MNTPEGWITRLKEGPHHYVNIVPQENQEPIITYFDHKKIYLPSEQKEYETEVLKTAADDDVIHRNFFKKKI
ncbi:MAG: hypothetical protein WC916_04180 [Candidatus Woesearchaeota archaeon]